MSHNNSKIYYTNVCSMCALFCDSSGTWSCRCKTMANIRTFSSIHHHLPHRFNSSTPIRLFRRFFFFIQFVWFFSFCFLLMPTKHVKTEIVCQQMKKKINTTENLTKASKIASEICSKIWVVRSHEIRTTM